ncbi:MAG: hypothetical protein DHS20C11_03840 [Lysobacteraceae bacterium]|nr:MAG: hypothetical protein DHS20C11_03840 [Xanthomonadaceae bacterium]
MRGLLALILFLMTCVASAATHVVQVTNNVFTPNDLTIEVGDTVQWINSQGFHDVVADDASFGNSAGTGWTFSHTFNQVGEVFYHCTVHSLPGRPISVFMNGRINVVDSTGGGDDFVINSGLDGVWSFTDDGRVVQSVGMVIDVVPAENHPLGENAFVGAIFTHDDSNVSKFAGDTNRWFTVQGTYDPASDSTTVPVFQVLGGDFMGINAGTTQQVGTATFEFNADCISGEISFDLFNSQINESWELGRTFADDADLCLSLTAP